MDRLAVASLFDDFTRARDAVTALEGAGVPSRAISMVANDAGSALATEMNRREALRREDSRARGIGVTVGLMLGGTLGLLASGGSLALPVIGHALAGSLVTGALAGAGLGAAAGATVSSLIGALVEAGVPEPLAHVYSEAVRRGGILVAVAAPAADAGRIAGIIERFEPVDLEAMHPPDRKRSRLARNLDRARARLDEDLDPSSPRRHGRRDGPASGRHRR